MKAKEKASGIVKRGFGSRPDFPSGKDYVDEVRGHLSETQNGEDTVMDDEQIAKVYRTKCKPSFIEGNGTHHFDYERSFCQAQAEITWKAREPEIAEARKAGIKEVVDEIFRDIVKEAVTELRSESLSKLCLIVERVRLKWQAQQDLPTIDEFIGSDPGFTGDQTTAEFLREERGK